jgi:hypothetical protein
MDISQIARAIDLFALAFVFGATVWFFFVQSPVLLKKLGREQFVPIQMRLIAVLFKTLTISLFIMLGASAGHSLLSSYTTIAAGIALVAVLINKFVVLPRALRAGGQSRADIKGKDKNSEGSTANFAVEGVGNRTKLLHRLVVLFVVIMLGGVAVHGIGLVAA